eukprot:1141639-Pelagomonas_calceolata.AAC.7
MHACLLWLAHRLVTDKDTGKPKGYAFCEYHDQFAAESAVRNLNAHDMSGRQIRVGLCGVEQPAWFESHWVYFVRVPNIHMA